MVLNLILGGVAAWCAIAVVGGIVLGRMIRRADDAEVGVDWWSEQ